MSAGHGRDAVRLLVLWAAIVCVVIAVGLALTGPLSTSVGVVDNAFERKVASRRTADLTGVAQAVSLLGETWIQLLLVFVLLICIWLVLRLVRPMIFLAVVAFGELAAYLVTVSVVSRPRPPVRLLDPGLEPLHSYPSGHVAAAMATYGGVAVLTWIHGGQRRRWLCVLLVLVPPFVAVGRLYLGAHHPTDVLVSLVFMSAWLAAAAAVVLPPPSTAAVVGDVDRSRRSPGLSP